MRRDFHAPVAAVTLLALGLTQSGCVTAKKYKMAKDGTPPASVFDWKASAASAELTLHTVIVFKGPGSWKREARWDEYVVTVKNHDAVPLVIDAAVLIDLLGVPREWGVDPWQLEKLSYTNWDKYGKTGLKLLAGAGAVTLYGGLVVANAVGGMGLVSSTAAAGTPAILTIIPVVAVVDITAVAIMNNQNKKKVQAEFNRRRLALPLTVAAGQTSSGSFFFPMTPGPKKLFLRGRRGDQPVELVLDLKPLAGLHLKPAGT